MKRSVFDLNSKFHELSTIRLQVFLAQAGICSRRGALSILHQGRIRVNGRVIKEPGYRMAKDDTVSFDGKPLKEENRKVYYILHKPAKYICSVKDQEKRLLAIDLVQPFVKERLFHVGRLDYMSSGVLFLTNDGLWARHLAHPSSQIEKEYVVQTKKEIPTSLLEKFRAGLWIDKQKFQCYDYHLQSPHCVRLILCEGKNREIRKVFQSQNITVKRVHRTRIGQVTLHGLEAGHFRSLTASEVKKLAALGLR